MDRRNAKTIIVPMMFGIITTALAGCEDAYAPGTEFTDCEDCPTMVVVPAGSFMMGSPPKENVGTDENPKHMVTIPQNFAVGKFEVTFAQWDACLSAGICKDNYYSNDEGWGRGNRPVMNVEWDDVKIYLSWISGKTGKTYRLLSEAEWEYAARAGTTSPRYWGASSSQCLYANGADEMLTQVYPDMRVALCNDGSTYTSVIGSYSPNAFGLHDMMGNVSEWTEDCYHYSYDGAPSNGQPWISGDCHNRVVRGGSWDSSPGNLISAGRYSDYFLDDEIGFRLARELE